jgi:23S rRNA (uracil1939-C5)-methyltransferase
MRKGDIIADLVVETMAAEGKCVAHHEGRVVFLQGGAPGDVVEAQIFKIKNNYLEARVINVQDCSPNREVPFCDHFGTCGGCSWQHISYDTQLFYKQKQVSDNLERIGGLSLPEIQPILRSDKTSYYRNRLDFTFSAERWMSWEEFNPGERRNEPALGYHIPRKYDKVFDVEKCHLQPDPSNAIRNAVKEEALKNDVPFFNLRLQTGFLRTLTVRSTSGGEIMIILQVTYDKMEWVELIFRRLEEEFPEVASLNYIINGKKNDTFHNLDVKCWKGNPYITETMSKPDGGGMLQFRIGPKSFYQTNSDQAAVLYKVAWGMAGLSGDEIVYDLYTGTGTIANFIAGHAKKVVGLEYVDAAIADAKVNSSINGITNTSFFAGDIKNLLDGAFISDQGKPDVVITDPPRAGMHEAVCKMLLEVAPQKIVYVSCNPATQARDLKILSEKYSITAVQPVDMFPHTMHVENVVKLERTQ